MYEGVAPAANYAPWRADEDFLAVYDQIKENTMVDVYRCYELWQLVAETRKLPGTVLEIGVWRGGTGALLAKRSGEAILCDTFQGVVKVGPQDGGYKNGAHADCSASDVMSLLERLGATARILTGVFPDETGHLVADDRFRFVHVDVDVYQSAKDISDWVWPRLVAGGMIIYDDYGFDSCIGVTRFVNEEREKTDRIVIHNLNGHAIVVKL